MKMSWTQRLTNIEIRSRIQEKEYIIPTIKQRKLAYFGHISSDVTIYIDNCWKEKINGNRGRGRPRQKWIDDIKRWTNIDPRHRLSWAYGHYIRPMLWSPPH